MLRSPGNRTIASQPHASCSRKKGMCQMSTTVCHTNPSPPKAVMEILETDPAADTGWNQFQNLPAWNIKKVNPKAEVVRQAKND